MGFQHQINQRFNNNNFGMCVCGCIKLVDTRKKWKQNPSPCC